MALGLQVMTTIPMGVLSKLLKPIGNATKAFFKHDLALKRGEQGVEIVLAPRAAEDSKPARGTPRVSDAAARKARAEFELLTEQLKELLDEIPESRGALKQLVFVEQALQKKGLKALHKLPLPVLRKALEQLEGLVTNWSPAGLANLRSKMAVAIIDREHHDPEKEADAYRTAAVIDHGDALPPDPISQQPEVEPISDDEALAAAYAALGSMAPTGPIEVQGELGSISTLALAPAPPRPTESAGEIQIRKLESTASA